MQNTLDIENYWEQHQSTIHLIFSLQFHKNPQIAYIWVALKRKNVGIKTLKRVCMTKWNVAVNSGKIFAIIIGTTNTINTVNQSIFNAA